MTKWNIDPDHSVASFAVKHLMVTNVRGQFNKITGTINFDPDNLPGSSVEAVIDVSSLTSGIRKRDEHLLSPDFFDVANYPQITFKSTKLDPTGNNKGRVTGDLTIHGVTRQVAFDAEFSGPVKSPFGGEITIGFTASSSINREDYGVMWNEAMEGGGVMVGRDVRIDLDIEADLVTE